VYVEVLHLCCDGYMTEVPETLQCMSQAVDPTAAVGVCGESVLTRCTAVLVRRVRPYAGLMACVCSSAVL
jgi:hypothetical protein